MFLVPYCQNSLRACNRYLKPSVLSKCNKTIGIGNFLLTKRTKKDGINLSTLFVPVQVKTNPDDINVGAELTGQLNKSELLKVLNKFYQRPEVKALAMENGLDSKHTIDII